MGFSLAASSSMLRSRLHAVPVPGKRKKKKRIYFPANQRKEERRFQREAEAEFWAVRQCAALQPSPARPPHPSPLPSDRERCVTDPPLYHWIPFISPRTRNPQDLKALVSSSLCRLGLTASHCCSEDTARPTTLAFSVPSSSCKAHWSDSHEQS